MICGGCNFAIPGGVDSGTAWRMPPIFARSNNGGCESELMLTAECAWWEYYRYKKSNKLHEYCYREMLY